MNIYWVYFTDTWNWETELRISILSNSEEDAIKMAQEWVVDRYNRDCEVLDINVDKLEVFKSENVALPRIINHTWKD